MSNPYEEPLPESTGSYIRLSDGEKVKFRVVEGPNRILKIFKDGTPKTLWVYGVVIYRTESKTLEPKILEAPISVFRQIKELYDSDEWGNPTEYDLIIKREGTGMNTRYTVIPGVKKPASKEIVLTWNESDLSLPEHNSVVDLREGARPNEHVDSGGPAPDPHDYDPFSDE